MPLPLPRALLVLALLAWARPVRAQWPAPEIRDTERPATPQLPAADTSAAPIAPADIPNAADRTLSRVAQAFAAVGTRPRLREILAGVPALVDTLGREDRIASLRERRLLTRRGLSSLSLGLAARERQVEEWQAIVEQDAAQVDSSRQRVSRALRRWRLTRAEQDSVGAFPELARRAGDVIASLARLDSALAARGSAILAGELALSEVRSTLFLEAQALAAAQAEARRELLQLDSPPLWRSPLPRPAADDAAAVGGFRRALPEIEWFVRGHLGTLLFQLVVTLGVIALALRHRTGIRETGEQAGVDAMHYRILRQPVAALALVSLMVVLWVYPRAPLVVYDLALVAAAVPLYLLIDDLVPPDLARVARLAVFLLVLQRLVTVAALGTPFFRLVQLGLSVAGAGLLWSGLRQGGALHRADTRWRRWLANVAWVLLGAFAVAAAANVVGNVTLADAVNAGVALTLFAALLLMAFVRLVDVFVSEGVKAGARRSRFLAERGPWVERTLVRLVDVAAVAGWAVVTLQAFYLWQPLAGWLRGVFRASARIGEASFSVGAVVTFVLVLWLGTLVARVVAGVLELDVLGRMQLRRGLSVTIGSMVRYALIAAAFLWAVAAVGVQLSDLTILGGALGVGIGFGLQNVVNNFVSGILLAFERPIGVGDQVQVGPHAGEVKQIGIRASVIRTYDGAEVIVPNSDLITKDVTNWTRTGTRRRFEIRIGTAYGSDPAQVLGILRDAAMQHPDVRAHPEPVVQFTGFGDSSLDFVLWAWTDAPNWGGVRSDVQVALYQQLSAAGIEIPFPQRDVVIRGLSPEVKDALGNDSRSDATST